MVGIGVVAEDDPPPTPLRTSVPSADLNVGGDVPVIRAWPVPDPEPPTGPPVVTGELVAEDSEQDKERTSWWLEFCGAFLIFAAIVVVVFYFWLSKNSPETSVPEVDPVPQSREPTLSRIRKAGVLHCGADAVLSALVDVLNRVGALDVYSKSGLSFDLLRNMDEDMCHAVAAAVLGDPSKVKIEKLPLWGVGFEEFMGMVFPNSTYNGQTDIAVTPFLLSPALDILGAGSSPRGYSFLPPMMYLDISYTGTPEAIDCLDRRNFTGSCSFVRVCDLGELAAAPPAWIPRENVVPAVGRTNWYSSNDLLPAITNMKEHFDSGECNAVGLMKYSTDFFKAMIRYDGELASGKTPLQSLPMGVSAIADGDPQWTTFVRAVFLSILEAERLSITKETAQEFGKTDLFGIEYEYMFINAIRTLGNRKEWYKSTLGPILTSSRSNHINDGSTGLIHSYLVHAHSRKDLEKTPDPLPGGRLAKIRANGFLTCVVRRNRPGFAEIAKQWQGIDVDLCTAVATAAQVANAAQVVIKFKEVEDEAAGYALLTSGQADIMAGAVWDLRNEVQGYSYSQPYFYAPDPLDTSQYDENLCLAVAQDDDQWKSFVFWTVTSIFYAEENGIKQSRAADMPLVKLFGNEFVDMFRNAIRSVGNYAEIYERNLSPTLPRIGRNELYDLENPGPLLYIPPGLRPRAKT